MKTCAVQSLKASVAEGAKARAGESSKAAFAENMAVLAWVKGIGAGAEAEAPHCGPLFRALPLPNEGSFESK